MKVSEVLIHNYKSICGEVKECKLNLDDRVTFLIGANESGKTNVLEAMLNFSLGGFEESDVPYLSRWCGKSNVPDDLKMVSVSYGINDEDKKLLEKIMPSLAGENKITITRNYVGEPYVSYPDIELESELNGVISNSKEKSNDIAYVIRKYIRDYKRIRKSSASHTGSVVMRLRSFLLEINSLSASFRSPQIKKVQRKVTRLRSAIKELNDPLVEGQDDIVKQLELIDGLIKEMPGYLDAKKASAKVWEVVPKFELVPVNPVFWLKGKYVVDDIINKPASDESLTSIRRLLALAELNPDSARSISLEMQTVELERASEKVTKLLRELWEQEPDIEVKFEWSPKGNEEIFIMIKSQGYRGFPQYRSLGFRWFLELYLLCATAVKSNVVLLFEEPGIYLHPNAQDYLKRVIRDSVARYGQIVYSTHLPNMYDLAYPEGCRAIRKDSGVTTIEAEYDAKHERVTWGVAMQALGIDFPQLRMCKENILTEGPADWVYLLTFARLLAEEFPEIASGIVHIHPCNGAKSIPAIVPFFFQQGVRSVILLDTDDAGNRAKKKVEERFRPPTENLAEIVVIDNVVDIESFGAGAHELEDIFGTEYYALLVSGCLGGERLDGKDFSDCNLIANKAVSLVKEKWGQKLNKYEVAWHFHDLVENKKTEIPEEAKTRFGNLLLHLLKNLREKVKR